MAQVATRALRPHARNPLGALTLPGPELLSRVRAPSSALVRDYLRFLGADPGAYARHGALTVPPHLFPQWALPLAARALLGAPYPIARILNGGCRLEVTAPIATSATLSVRARLLDVNDDGRRAVLHQRVVTDTDTHAGAIIADLYGVVPSSQRAPDRSARGPERKRLPVVPADARELTSFAVGANDGLAFALLTGDFNPIHWLSPYARASGFPRPILHGFALIARAMEGLAGAIGAENANRIAVFDVRFSRPLPLGSRVGLYVAADGGSVFVADAKGGRPYLTGTFEEKQNG